MEACHEALQRLQTDYLDLYFVTDPTPMCPLKSGMTMHNLIQQGKVLYWEPASGAVRNYEAHRVADRYHLIAPTVEQPQYNMFERLDGAGLFTCFQKCRHGNYHLELIGCRILNRQIQ